MIKKKPISNRRAKKALTRAVEPNAEVTEPAVVPTPVVEAAEKPAKRPRARAAKPRTPRAKPAAALLTSAATPSVAAAPPAVAVEKTDEGVVIRFAPAAPPPFPVDVPATRSKAGPKPGRAEEAPRPLAAPAARSGADDDDADEVDSRRAVLERVENTVDEFDAATPGAGVPGTVDRVADDDSPYEENGRSPADAPFTADRHAPPHRRGAPGDSPRDRGPTQGGMLSPDEERRLSPSQKRRLRRKRRAQERREGGPSARPAQQPPMQQRPAPPPARRDPAVPPAHRPPPVAAPLEESDDQLDDRMVDRPDIEPSFEERFERDTDLPGEVDTDEGPTEALPDVSETGDVSLEPRQERGPRDDRGERGGGRRRGRRGRGRGRRRDGTWEPRPDEATEDGELPAGRDVRLEAVDVESEPSDEAAPRGATESDEAAAPVETRREMIINIVPREECRIAILADGKLEEIYLERASAENHVGNIYKGVVTNVEPSIQAAFVDFGLGKNGFLHISDLHPQYFREAAASSENVGRKMPRRRRPPIQRCLRRGQTVLVQITKEGIGTKGPTLTTYLSIPGRFLVMMPGMRELGVSRKIEDDDQRRKLRSQLDELELPEDMGFIARTAAQDRTKRELQSDLNYLVRLWRAVERRIKDDPAPAELYRETDLVIRTIRDVFASDVGRVLVDNHEVAERAREFLSIFSPRSRDTVVEYEGPEPIFHRFGIEAELERLHSRHVPLRSGGSLVIDQTEALVAIDVNSGRFRTEDDAEITAYKMNMEAADEIPRQLRLRDMGGVVICDFIDMREEKHRRDIERRLIRNLKQHKERAKVLRMSSFGIIEMTRQRQRASLTRSVYQDCFHCRGTGLVKTVESVALDVMRLVQLAVTKEHIRVIEVKVSAEVADVLLNRKRAPINDLEAQYRRTISIKPDPTYGLDQVQIQCFDQRNRLVPQG